jgi:phospholipid/cholesterol/gamma-HCH transport system substrate-binding protein
MADRDERDDRAEREEEAEETAAAPPSRGRDQAIWVGFFLVVGIIAILAALFILTDAAFFRGRYIVTTTVPNAGGIRRGDPVQMRGVNIGRIQKFKISKDQVDIRLELEGEYDVPADSKVELKSAGLLGGMVADIVPGDAQKVLHNGDHIPGTTEEAMMDTANRIAGQAEKVIGQVQKILTDATVHNVSATAENTQVATRDLRRLVGDISGTVAEQRKQLTTLEASLQKSAGGLERVTTGPELDRALKRMDTLGERMDTVTESLNRSATSVETVTSRLARGEGTAGKLMTDDELYRRLNESVNNMNQATVSLNRLVDDIQKNPRKYINLKVF